MEKLTFKQLTEELGKRCGFINRDEEDDLLNEIEKCVDDKCFNFIWESGLLEFCITVEGDQYTLKDITKYSDEEIEKACAIMEAEGLSLYKFKKRNIDIANYEFN